MMTEKKVVVAEKISKSFGEVKALSDVSFEIEKGELFGIIGPDGSGKTTLFRILVTLMLPDSGFAKVLGLDTDKDFKKIRPLVGYMPGRFSLYQDLTVEENLEFYATIFGTTIEENYSLIKNIYVQIEPFKKRLAGKLSGGMKQKLALCCAMIHKPEILVLDEPTTGVDAVSRKEFWELLAGLQKQGITILVSTPYMDEAGLCDRVILIQNGRILDCGQPEAIISKFPSKLFSVSSGNMHRLISDLRNFSESATANLFGQTIHFFDQKKSFNEMDLIRFLTEKGHSDIKVDAISAGIEDCFINLMESQQ